MDEADQAQALEDEYLRRAIAQARAIPQITARPVADCLGCGAAIPAARRAAMPGCCLCVGCQESAERAMER